MKLKKGYIQVYTGNGKGKTTAALGLALRAAGAGLKVYISQFIKKGCYSELNSLRRFRDRITFSQCGRGCLIRKPNMSDRACAENGIKSVEKIIKSRKFDIVILDEINVALHLKLITIDSVLNILKNKPSQTEIILTGRYAPKQILKLADLVTEMREIKHYYRKNTKCRVGIER